MITKTEKILLHCKNPGCLGRVTFNGVSTVPGNFFHFNFVNRVDNSLEVRMEESLQSSVSRTDPEEMVLGHLTLGTDMITKSYEVTHQRNQPQEIQHEETFYLPCEFGHFNPYVIRISG